MRTLQVNLEAVNTSSRSDKEQVVIFATKGHICRRFRYFDAFNPLARLIKYSHTGPGKIDVALSVDGHAVRTEFAEEAFVREIAIGLDILGVVLSCDVVRHVKHLAVGRANDTVGLNEVGRDTRDGLVVGRDKVNVFAVHPHAGVVRRIEIRIGKIGAAVWTNPQVIGAVEYLAAEVRHQHIDPQALS